MLPTVVFDESGNTGADLVRSKQPTFVLSSCDFSLDESRDLLEKVLTHQTVEPKISKMKKSNSGRRRVIDFITSNAISKDRAKVFYFHKEFMALTKVVDLLIENVAHETGFDLYKEGMNIAMSNMLCNCMPAFCGNELYLNMLDAFVVMFREKTPKSIGDFYSQIERMVEVSERHEFKSSLAPIRMSSAIIDEILKNNSQVNLDPAIPGFFTLCDAWGRQFKAEFGILHDDSKPISQEQPNLESLMDPDAKPELVGYDRRQFELPLRCREIKFGDSKTDTRLQVADLIASTCNYWARGLTDDSQQDTLWNELNELELISISSGVIWPSADVTPTSLGTDAKTGTNPVDGVMKHRTGV